MDSLVDALLDSEGSFQDWAAAVLLEIGKVLLKMAALEAAKMALDALSGSGDILGDFIAGLGFAKGNAFPGGTSLPKNSVLSQATPFMFASGGVFGSRMGIGGEAGSEALVPLTTMASGNLGVESSPVFITVNNTMSETAKVEVAENQKSDGGKEITVTIRRELRAAMADGSMDSSMKGNYGMSRRALA
jgi:lambda family phage tail tape measure protein